MFSLAHALARPPPRARREKLASQLKPNSPAPVEGSDDEDAAPSKPAGKSFGSLGYEDMLVDEDDDEGGLMSQIAKSSKKKDKKKSKQAAVEEDEEDFNAEPAQDLSAPRGAVEAGADDWMEEEFGSAKEKKGKKGKKGGNKKAAPVEESEDEAVAEVTQAVEEVKIAESKPAPAAAPKEDAAGSEEPTGVLSKKEKERIKKEKEKVRLRVVR